MKIRVINKYKTGSFLNFIEKDICYTYLMNNKKSDYDNYLSLIHAKLVTPDEIIKEIVAEGTSQDILFKEKIIAGEANEVYDITLADNVHVILRISRSGYPNFLQEKWALEQVKNLEVPIPEIILIQYKKLKDVELSFCLMKKVDGEPLERGKIDFSSLSEDKRKSYIVKAGEILSKIHSVKTLGFGWIIGNGKAEFDTSDKIIDELLNKKERIYKISETKNLDNSEIDSAFEIIDNFRKTYLEFPTFLNHGDYGHKHFMVKDEKIVAILDWGGVRSESPIYEFACWDYWFGESIPTEWLKEGYLNKSLFDKNFDNILRIFRIMKGIEVIDWYASQGYDEAVEKAIQKLKSDLNYFK